MDFFQFAQIHGLLIRYPVKGKITRCATEDHPRKKNGAYFFDGERGWVCNWAIGDEIEWWQSDGPMTADRRAEYAKERQAMEVKRKRLSADAAKKADDMLKRSVLDAHPYLERKGFPLVKAPVLDGKLIVRMESRSGAILGAQEIDATGVKKFIFGMSAKGARHNLGTGKKVLCEGFATGLSIRASLRSMGRSEAVCVCFSAQNMKTVAEEGGAVLVFADNDQSETGERVAKEIGLPWLMSPVVGEDANDWWLRSKFDMQKALAKSLRLS